MTQDEYNAIEKEWGCQVIDTGVQYFAIIDVSTPGRDPDALWEEIKAATGETSDRGIAARALVSAGLKARLLGRSIAVLGNRGLKIA